MMNANNQIEIWVEEGFAEWVEQSATHPILAKYDLERAEAVRKYENILV